MKRMGRNSLNKAYGVYKMKKVQVIKRDKHINGRRIKCFFAGAHKNLAEGYTEFRFLPNGDIEYWGVCAYCGGPDSKLFMKRHLFDRVYPRTRDWVEVDKS